MTGFGVVIFGALDAPEGGGGGGGGGGAAELARNARIGFSELTLCAAVADMNRMNTIKSPWRASEAIENFPAPFSFRSEDSSNWSRKSMIIVI